MHESLKFFKNNLKKIRIDKGLTVKELASKVNMAQPNVTNLENNKSLLSLPLVENFASALKCSPFEIISDRRDYKGVDLTLIEKISNLTKNINVSQSNNYHKIIITLYLSLLNLKNNGINIEKVEDSEVGLIIKAIVDGFNH